METASGALCERRNPELALKAKKCQAKENKDTQETQRGDGFLGKRG